MDNLVNNTPEYAVCGVSYSKNIGDPEALGVFSRMPHVSIDVWENTMPTPRSFQWISHQSFLLMHGGSYT